MFSIFFKIETVTTTVILIHILIVIISIKMDLSIFIRRKTMFDQLSFCREFI